GRAWGMPGACLERVWVVLGACLGRAWGMPAVHIAAKEALQVVTAGCSRCMWRSPQEEHYTQQGQWPASALE
ncbi:hypothetical protein CYMTET_38382, partial [Cymbomonas tetramitiformis]